MTFHGMAYNETTDLYMQLLSEARKMEDKRLVKMILQRVMARHQKSEMPGGAAGKIIPLPSIPVPRVPAEPEGPFWMQEQFWQDMLPFISVLSVAMFCFVYVVYLAGAVNRM